MPRLHHVNVIVPVDGVAPVLSFYRDLIGLRPIEKTAGNLDRGAWLELDDRIQLHLSEDDGRPHRSQHFAVQVDDLDSIVARLRANGHPFEPADGAFGTARGFTRDPAGNRVELIGAPQRSA